MPKKKYEYRRGFWALWVGESYESYLNRLGAEGWDLVSAEDDHAGRSLCVFKREIIEEQNKCQ